MTQTTPRTLIYPEWLVDGSGAPAEQGYALAFSGSHIEAVGPKAELPQRDGDIVIDAPGMSLLPGLINMHAHLNLVPDNSPFIPYMDAHSDVALGFRSAFNARACLESGITTVRDCGSRGRTVLDLRAAQAQGLVDAPRVVTAGCALTISGGHMRPFGGECDGVEGVRQMVRRLVSAGVDFIKVAGSGGGTPGSLSEYPSFSVEELRAIADAAHGLGRKVTVHCTATAAIGRAADAGVDSLEHGFFVSPNDWDGYDPALADRLAESGISVTPTLQVFRDMGELMAPGAERDSWQRRRDSLVRNLGKLHAAGVRVTAGSDAGWRFTRFDNYARELDLLHECGLRPLEVIHAATAAASEAIGRADEFGSLRPGLSADLLLVKGNVAEDVRHVASVQRVYVEGRRLHSIDE